jgi:hypothetical protein
MKKFTIALILILALAVGLLAACGDTQADPSGKYVLKSMDGQPVEEYFKSMLGEDVDLALQMFGISSFEELMTVELKADGSAEVTMAGQGSYSGVWEQDGDKITVTVDGEPATFILQGNELSFEESGESMVFVKK